MTHDHAPTVTEEPGVSAELLAQWGAEVDAVAAMDDADLLQRLRNLEDPTRALLVDELAWRYGIVAAAPITRQPMSRRLGRVSKRSAPVRRRMRLQ